MFFGSLWNPSIFDGINQKKDKTEDIYILLFDESLIQQFKNKQLDTQATLYTRIKLKNLNRKLKGL